MNLLNKSCQTCTLNVRIAVFLVHHCLVSSELAQRLKIGNLYRRENEIEQIL